MKRLTITIELLEDLHIGTGTGWGDIDALQVRDRRGWPVIPASHIKGLLREAANEWLKLDPSALPEDFIPRLFGQQGSGQGQLQLTSATLSTEQTTLVWGSTQIASTGAAADESLRFVEYIPAGSKFTLQASLPADDEQTEDFFKAIIARCPRLGSGRNRGHGRVRWGLADPVASAPLSLTSPKRFPSRLRLVMRNLEPICLARTGHPGNLISTEAFIRGRSLRGAVVGACLANGHTEWAQTLLDPMLAWADALPLPANVTAKQSPNHMDVLPIPLSVGTPKATAPSGQLPWWAYKRDQSLFGARQEIDQITLRNGQRPPEKLKRPGAGEFLFQATPDAPWQRYKPQILERLHTQVPSKANEFKQALFSTEEIAEHTLFLADLIVTSAEQASTLIEVLDHLSNQWLRMGRGGHPLVIESASWLPVAEQGPATDANTNGFTVLLESELIARDHFGNFIDRLDAATLASLAGLPNANLKATQHSFSEGCDLFGFNASTGLPRLGQRAIKAGSVIHVEGDDAAKVYAALAGKLALGECPEEGFGRFRLNRLPQPYRASTGQDVQASPTASRNEDLCQQARQWVNRFGNSLSKPSNSQWGELRSRLQAARNHRDIAEAFRTIEQARDKHGGKAWKDFVESNSYKPFLAELTEMTNTSLRDAQELLELFTRWQRATKTTADTDKHAEEKPQ